MSSKTLTAFEIHVPAPGVGEVVSIHGIHSRNTDDNAPAILLLHGMPQNLSIWHAIIPELSKRFHVVATNLRGYGQSSKPPQGEKDVNYSKRQMANDQVHVMTALGYKKFYLVGHDRGGRVAHRLVLDHPEAVIRLLVLDILPTLYMYNNTNCMFADAYWHWFFLIQDYPLPEQMVGANPARFCALHLRKAGGHPFDPTAYSTYLEDSMKPGWSHALVADYRASAPGGIDLTQDEADLKQGKKISIPVRCIYGSKGAIPMFDADAAWSQVCEKGMYQGSQSVNCGHYIPEHASVDVLKEISEFFS